MAVLVSVQPATRLPWSLEAPSTPDGLRQAHMWNILRGPMGRAGISAEQLALYSSTETLPIDDRQAGVYLAALLTRDVVRRAGDDLSYYRIALEHRRQVFAPRMLTVPILYVAGRKLGTSLIEAVEGAL